MECIIIILILIARHKKSNKFYTDCNFYQNSVIIISFLNKIFIQDQLMCGRFAQAVPLGGIIKINLLDKFTESIPYNYKVAPGETASTILRKEKNVIQLYNGNVPDDNLMFLAGIYSINDPAKNDYTFAVLTIGSIKPVNMIHERMPAIISEKNIQTWLDSSTDNVTLCRIMMPDESIKINIAAVTSRVNNVRYKSEDCIAPVLQ